MGADDWKGEGIIRNVPRDRQVTSSKQAAGGWVVRAQKWRECEAHNCSHPIRVESRYRFCRWCMSKTTLKPVGRKLKTDKNPSNLPPRRNLNMTDNPQQSNAAFPKMQLRIEGLVRDRNGKPRIDGDPNDLPQSVKDAMTDEEFRVAVAEWKARDIDGKT